MFCSYAIPQFLNSNQNSIFYKNYVIKLVYSRIISCMYVSIEYVLWLPKKILIVIDFFFFAWKLYLPPKIRTITKKIKNEMNHTCSYDINQSPWHALNPKIKSPQIMKHKHKNIYGIFQHKKSADAKKQKKRKSLPGDYMKRNKNSTNWFWKIVYISIHSFLISLSSLSKAWLQHAKPWAIS